MPRGQKNMPHAREKCNQESDDSKSHKTLQAASVEEEDSPCCSSSVLGGNPQIPSATVTSSTSQGSWTASSTTIASSRAFHTRYDKDDESLVEENAHSSNTLSSENSWSEVLTMNVELKEQYLLHKYKTQQPILKEEIIQIVGENQDEFDDIFQKASDLIEAVFAVDLKEVDSSTHVYDLVSKLNLPNNGRVYAGRGLPKMGLLLNILGLIFIKGNRASEEEMWQFLNMLEVYAGRKHRVYGEPRKLINTDLVQLQYLEYRQVPDNDPARYEFLWGPRAHAETSKMQVLEFWAKVNDTVPNALSPWYEEALQDEERTRATEAVRAATAWSFSHVRKMLRSRL
uniref:MAGE domain-containing protein n=1 Tax=Rhinolophus ferrumequinum TaxID=59479 RepID=A0A671EFM9_RHIFE